MHSTENQTKGRSEAHGACTTQRTKQRGESVARTALVLRVACRIAVQLEEVGLGDLDTTGHAVVELRHAHDLGEGDQVALLKLEALVVDARHDGGAALRDAGHDASVRRLPCTAAVPVSPGKGDILGVGLGQG